jgi:hypothetical protein
MFTLIAQVTGIGNVLQRFGMPNATGYQGIIGHDSLGLDYQVTKQKFEDLLKEVVRDFQLDPHKEQISATALHDAILSRIKFVTENEALAKGAAKIGVLVAIYFYNMHCPEAQFLIGLYSAFYVIVDDAGYSMTDDIALFRRRLLSGERQPELFELMKWLFTAFDERFPAVCSNKLFSSVLNTLSVLEVEFNPSADFAITPASSPLFPKYFRNMTGSSEVYVYFLLTKENYTMARMKLLIQAVPELLNITDEINDLFSFYKESVTGIERDTYVYHEAKARGTSPLTTLRQIATDIRRRQQLISRIFSSDAVLQRLSKEYITGQMQFYLTSERYLLADLTLV